MSQCVPRDAYIPAFFRSVAGLTIRRRCDLLHQTRPVIIRILRHQERESMKKGRFTEEQIIVVHIRAVAPIWKNEIQAGSVACRGEGFFPGTRDSSVTKRRSQ